MEAVGGYSMNHINNKKIEVNEIGKEVVDSRKEYLNYHKSRRGLFAIKV